MNFKTVTFLFSCLGVSEVKELWSTQEEADTRLLLHANYVVQEGSGVVVIVADDTDVLVLALVHHYDIKGQLYLVRGNSDTQRIIDISHVGKVLGPTVCKALSGIHAFTGSDCTSAFSGQGKLKALKLLNKDKRYQELFATLGLEWELSEDKFQLLEEFTCHLYAARTMISSVNTLRYHIFSAKRGNLHSKSNILPPSQDPLKQHCLRANYVAGIWKRSLEPMPDIPSPIGYGWKENNDGQLSYLWMTCSPAPAEILKMIVCDCRSKCTPPSCPCASAGITCIEACNLKECENFLVMDDRVECNDEDSDDDTYCS